MKSLVSKWVILFGALCGPASFASESILPAAANVFQVAMSDPNDVVAADCPQITSTENPYIIHSQEGIDKFGQLTDCHKVPYLSVSGHDINNLNGFKYIKEITHGEWNHGYGVYIGPISSGKDSYANDLLTSLSGFDELTKVKGNIIINQNDALLNVNAFNNVKLVKGSITVFHNHNLETTRIFANKLERVTEDVNILGNAQQVQFLDSFKHLKKIKRYLTLSASNTPSFPSLQKINGGLYISSLPVADLSSLNLVALQFIGKQIGIYKNTQLKSLKGLSHIIHLSNLAKSDEHDLIYFVANPKLQDCSQLSQLYKPSESRRYRFMKTPKACQNSLETKM